jgi:hypothetical protein
VVERGAEKKIELCLYVCGIELVHII